MTLESIYYLSQIVAAVAILVSLIFVGLQMRQSARNIGQTVAVFAIISSLVFVGIQVCVLPKYLCLRSRRPARRFCV